MALDLGVQRVHVPGHKFLHEAGNGSTFMEEKLISSAPFLMAFSSHIFRYTLENICAGILICSLFRWGKLPLVLNNNALTFSIFEQKSFNF
jgi:hypothetical protein